APPNTPALPSFPTRRSSDLNDAAGPECEVVLLGSIASGKYVEPLLPIFGSRLVFPRDFVGRGDMSRGGLMLRSATAGQELEYIPDRKSTRLNSSHVSISYAV